jgi:hypothetical protein
MHDLANPLDAAAFPRLAVPNAPVQTFDLGDDYGLRRNPVRVVVDKFAAASFVCCNESRCGISLNLESCPRVDQKVSVRPTVSRVRRISAVMSVSVQVTAQKPGRHHHPQ